MTEQMSLEEAVHAIAEHRAGMAMESNDWIEVSAVAAMIGALVVLGVDEGVARRAGVMVLGKQGA